MTTPSIVPSKYAGTSKDYLRSKIDRSGAVRTENGAVSVPSSTASGTIVGLVPFRKGASLARLFVVPDDLDTSTNVTLDLGYVYDSASFTDAPAAFLSASTAAQTGVACSTAYLKAANTWVADGDGWIVARTGGGSTTTTGSLNYSVGLAYDQ